MKTTFYTNSFAHNSVCKLIIAVLLIGNSFWALGQVPVPFTQRTSSYTPTQTIYHVKGDFTMIGNTNLTLVNYNDNTPNSNSDMMLVDMDGNSATTNSSSATLTFSTENGAIPSCSNIIYAGLYWSARADNNMPSATKRHIEVKGPGQSAYQTFTATTTNILYPVDPNYSHMYVAYVEVTDLVKQYGLGEYWVANMGLTAGHSDGTGFYGGWSMVVIYENSKMKWRDVTLFDGYAYISSQTNTSYTLPVSGFNTVQSGQVNMKLGVMAGEGDRPFTGDYFQIRNHTNTAWVDLSDACNTTNNFFNSSVCTGGNYRNPNLLNNTGIDVHMFYIPNANNSVITNNQTSTMFQYGSAQDTYVIFAMAMAVDAYVPTPEGLNQVTNIGGVPYIPGNPLVAFPGDTVQLQLNIMNKGTEPINNMQIVIPIPYGASYVSCAKTVNFTPLPTPNNLSFNPSLGANGSIVWNMGTLPLPSNPNTVLATLTYKIRVTDDCSILVNPNCTPEVVVNGTFSGVGATSGTSFTDFDFISGYQTSGICIGEPISDPITIGINATAYIAQYCQGVPAIREFVYCNVGSTIPITSISGNFPPGSRFYNQYPVTLSATEYTISNPFPALSGTHTYYAVPPGTTNCYFEFKIIVTNITTTPTVAPVAYCLNDAAVPLTATPTNATYTLYYYTSLSGTPQLSITPSTSAVGTTTYYVAEGVSASCISPNKASITVTVHALPTVGVTSNSPVCTGGTLQLGATGGVSYLWSGPDGYSSILQNPTVSNMSSSQEGLYTVQVTNSFGCKASGSVNISTLSAVSISSTVVPTTCGLSNGSATAIPSGGTTPYTYHWSNNATTQTISNIPAGSYFVTVTDFHSCFNVANVIVNPGSLFVNVVNTTNILCYGYATGSATVLGGGGANLQYSLNGGTYQPSGIFNGLTAGFYTVAMQDASSCVAYATFTITQQGELKPKSVAPPVQCFGGTTTVSVTATGGVSPYSGTGQFTVGQGVHNYLVTDFYGCSANTSISINQPALLTASTSTPAPILCNGGNTTVTVSANGGTTPYSGTGTITVGAGTHTFTVTDANGCTATSTITISQPPIVLSAASSAGTIDCNGGLTYVTITANGGTPPYYDDGTYNSVPAGTYTYIVTDDAGCTASTTITVSEPTSFAATASATTIMCTGDSTTIMFTASGGTPPYSGTGSIKVPAGTYSRTITDFNYCSSFVTITVTEPPLLAASASAQGTIQCFGGETTVGVSATGGTTPYLGTGQFVVNAGMHNYTIMDAHGCLTYTSINVTQPDSLYALATAAPIICNGGNATINVNGYGGTQPYSGTGQFTHGPGIYNYTVEDAHGCTVYTSIQITEPTTLSASIAGTNVSCFNGNNGAADLTVSGGVTPYTYLWSNAATTEDLNGLEFGIYSVTVTDSLGCQAFASVEIAQPALLTAAISGTNITCYSGNDGAADLTVQGGVTPYTFMWSNSATSEDLTGLNFGIYSVTVTDFNGCHAYASVEVTQPPLLTAVIAGTNVNCFNGNDGAADLTVQGGVTPYTFLWSNNATSEDLTGLTFGNYSVTVTDLHGCHAYASVEITQPPLLTAVIAGTNVSCFNGNDGAADLTVQGGVTPYTFLWSNNAATEDLTGLTFGNYSVTVTDLHGCPAYASVEITQPPQLTAVIAGTNVTCFGGNDGATDLTVTGGVTPYSYLWSNSATTEDLTGLIIGIYSVTVTDLHECTAFASVEITQPPQLTAAIIGTNVTCFGGNDGAADLIVSGGVEPYTYLWSNMAVTQDISGLIIGVYSVTVTDLHGCHAYATVEITEPPLLTAAITGTNVTCFGGNDGAADLVVNGGVTPYIYLWSNGAATEDLAGLIAGVYAVTVTDLHGCHAYASVEVTEPPLLTAVIAGTNVTCNGGSDGAADLTIEGGVPTYIYEWSNSQMTEDLSGLTAGLYSVTVTDMHGCHAYASIDITEPPLLSVAIAGTNVSCTGGNDGAVDLTMMGGVAPYQYIWSNGANTEDLHNVMAGFYSVTVTDGHGCYGYAYAEIIDADLIIPTITCPGNQTRNTSEMECIYTAVGTEFDPLNYNDNCPVTVQNNYNGLSTLANATFSPGVHTIIWTVADAANNTATCSFTVTIQDTEPPVILCSTIPDQGICQTDSVMSLVVPMAYDNCGILSVLSNAPAVFPVGTTYVTWVATDIHGNTASCSVSITRLCSDLEINFDINATSEYCSTFPVTVTANASSQGCLSDTNQLCFESPTIPDVVSAKINWTYWTFNADNTVTIRTTFAKTFVDNTYGTHAIGWPSGHTFANLVGSDRLQLTLYDANNVTKMVFTMDYISQDATAPSGYSCLGVTGGEGSIQLGNLSDFIDITSSLDKNFNEYGYVLTTNSPLTDANYTPNPTYPNWIYDVWYEVTIKLSAFGPAGFGSPNITFIHASPSKTGNNSEDVIPVPCEEETDPGQNIYVWSTGATTQTILAGSPGIYTVTVTLPQGCYQSASVDVTPAAIVNPLADYVMLTRTHIQLKQTTVYSGGLGVTDDYPENHKVGKLEVKEKSKVTASGTFARSSHLTVDNTSQVAVKYNTAAQIKFPVFQGMPYHSSVTVNVPANTTMMLTDTLYKEIKIGKNATAVFTKKVVNIEKGLKTETGATLRFQNQCATVRSAYTFDLGENVTINPDNYFIRFYISKDMKVKAGANVTGVFYLGDATHSNDTTYHHLHIEDSKVTKPAIFRGVFIAECIHSGKYTNWYKGDFCSYVCPITNKMDDEITTEQIIDANGVQIRNYPNPFSDKTKVVFTVPKDDHVTLKVYDLSGKLIQTLYSGDVSRQQEYSVEFNGKGLPSGIYIYRMTTNDDVFTGKMMMVKE